jgi:hypothetical protein
MFERLKKEVDHDLKRRKKNREEKAASPEHISPQWSCHGSFKGLYVKLGS